MKNNFYLLFVILFSFVACSETVARRPKKHSTTNFYKDVIAQNKKLNKIEKKNIEKHLAKDTTTVYKASLNGFWYAYVKKDTTKSLNTVKKGDLVTLHYNVTDINNNVLYKEQVVDYKVDMEDFIPGLQEGVKLMKKGEKMMFIIPSYRAYGVTGDGNQIRMNQTIKSTINLIDIKNEKKDESK